MAVFKIVAQHPQSINLDTPALVNVTHFYLSDRSIYIGNFYWPDMPLCDNVSRMLLTGYATTRLISMDSLDMTPRPGTDRQEQLKR